MNPSDEPHAEQDRRDCLAGGGEMGALMRSLDWSKTPLGPVASWSPTLQTTVRTLLVNRFPLLLWWGPQYIQLYNDAYRPIPGAKHPRSMGQPARECWPEIWHVIGPLIDTPFRGGPATWMEDICLEVNRHGFAEETHFTIAYSPVPDETAPGGIGGVLGTVHEITAKVVGERRMVALRDLAIRPAEAKTAEEACAVAAKTLAAHDKDVPFALLYLADADGKQARLAGAAGVERDRAIFSPPVIDLDAAAASPWPLAEVRRTEQARIVADLGSRFGSVPPGPWSDSPREAVVLPIGSSKARVHAGFLVAGVSARLRLDDAYRGFLELAAAQIATAVASARAYEEEKRRAEALAELDRAKTAFFSNVSHEFRTPLTLMLGPVEDLLARGRTDLSANAAEQLEVVHRNGLRLLRLVNTLLDFSRIEAGRIQAAYQPTDLAAVTADLASVFRAAVEKAGLRLVVDCPPLAEPVFVDRQMWEKIVLNLLSNAFKFTFAGEIAISMRQTDNAAQLRVRDTGTGIPAEEMPRLFERFHRIPNSRGRTHEGSGIGLALVQELVRLHGGCLTAESVVGRGTTFTVTLPLGSAHLPPGQVGDNRSRASTASGASSYVEEALRWLPDEEKEEGGRRKEERIVGDFPFPPSSFLLPPSEDDRPRVLVADDNADMRQRIVRLLAEHYRTEVVPDGEAALAAARERPPDLILADVMMPRLDGFGLLRELRADPGTRGLPVIFLSARAGEEARVEGLDAGADDYLVKPFGSKELLARVSAHLKMARLRQEASAALLQADRRKDEFLATLSHEIRNLLVPLRTGLELMKLARNDAAAVEQARTTMERQLVQIVQLIDDLLDLGRFRQGKIALRKGRIPLAAAVRNAVETTRPLIEGAGHALVLDVPDAPIFVDADETRLSQVFANLLSNAAKYTERGGRIRLAVERQGDEAVATVADNGVGIPAHVLPRVFDLFMQEKRSLEKSQGGLGIGLSVAKRLVEMHGGSIEAHSDGPGKGSRFVVRLPVAPPVKHPSGDAVEPQAAPTARRRILVVDDNRDIAAFLAMVLDRLGHETQTAHDGLEAVAAVEAFRPDVVLLDIGMPKLNGYDAARRIREQPWGKTVVLVALTGWGQEEDRQESREAGFHFHLVKPIEPAALEKLLAGLQTTRA
jgi:signal transduction histidine kinase